jgi:hypothetical protein
MNGKRRGAGVLQLLILVALAATLLGCPQPTGGGQNGPSENISATINLTGPTSYSVDFGTFDGVLQAGESVEITANVSGGAESYQWYVDGTAIDGATAAQYTVEASLIDEGTYELSVVVAKDGLAYSGSITVKVVNSQGGEA